MNTNIKIKQALLIATAIVTVCFSTTCKKVDPLLPPTNINVKQEGETIRLTWKAGNNATGYKIYRSATGTDYAPLVNIPDCYYIDNLPLKGMNYYKITSSAFRGEVESLESGYVTCDFVPPTPPPPPPPPPDIPTNVGATQNGLTVVVSWDEVKEVIGYNVYRCNSASGEYSSISDAAISKTNFTDNCPLTGDNFYKITAINSAGGESGMSGYAMCDFRHIPILTTLEATNISFNSVTLGGNISHAGSPLYTERGVCWSTSANPTTSNSKKQVSGSGTGDYTTTVTDLEAGNYYARAYAINAEGTAYGNQISFLFMNISTGDAVVINGVKWATCNVDKPGTFTAKPESAGMFYQWNRKIGWSATGNPVNSDGGTTWDNSTPDGTTWEPTNDPSPTGYRVPTKSEIEKLLDANKVKSTWITHNGVAGGVFIDKNNGNSIFLPAAGYRLSKDGMLDKDGTNGYYWSSTQYDAYNAYRLGFGNVSANCDHLSKTHGRSVRPVVAE